VERARRNSAGKPRVLMELRPCFDGFAGIPQETRVLFSSFHDLPGIDPVGLINHSARRLARATPSAWMRHDPAMRYDRVSKMIISCEDDEPATPIDRLRLKTARPRAVANLAASSGAGVPIRIHPVESDKFSDYIWQRLFAKGLAPDEFERIRDARYVSIQPPWLSMHTMGMLRRYPRVDTRDFDIFVAHTPWPSRVSPRTEMVVRYHDAIPMFHPHQIKLPAMHQFHHASALRSNVQHASFVCTSEATCRDLLTLYPEVEPHTRVIPTSVSSDYHPEPASEEIITEVIRSYMRGGKPPKQTSAADEHGFRYLLMVSTIEPRKNHVRLIEAWERLRRLVDPDLQLVVVGSLGWGHGPITERMKKWQQRGSLHHLNAVPTADLRLLYSNAEATVCPSVVEGFDMSGIESMICGGPVAASDIDVHRENYGSAALYFDPYSTEDLVRVLRRLLYGENAVGERQALIDAGLAQAKLFRRAELAEQWGELFEDIAAGRFGVRRLRKDGA
jgi:glycosyltransferase involved in cell wall biosynthesis